MKSGLELIKSSFGSFNYYRSTLDDQMRHAYDSIKNAILSYRDSIRVLGLSSEQIQTIYEMLRHDCPWLFYVDMLSYEKYLLTNAAIVRPVYRMDKSTADSYVDSVVSHLSPLISTWKQLPREEAEKQVHDYFCRNIEYDNSPSIWSFECLGPLLHNRGVCEGISRAVKLIFDSLHIPTIVIHGKVQNQVATLQFPFGNVDGHTWNLVSIDNCFYHVDLTFDITVQFNNMTRYDYFNLSDKEIMIDHELPQKTVLPKCCVDSKFYKSKGMFMGNPKEFYTYIMSCLKQKRRDIIFQVPYTKEFNKIKLRVLSLIKKCLSESFTKVVLYQLHLNPNRCVFHLYMQY